MVTYLHQCFPAIFTNSFEPQSLNYDPDNDMFYSLNTSLPPGHDIITMEKRKFSDVLGSHVEKLLIYQKVFFTETMVWLISNPSLL